MNLSETCADGKANGQRLDNAQFDRPGVRGIRYIYITDTQVSVRFLT